MQPDTENLEQRIDREKRQREDELLLLLLTLFLRARSHADLALRLGASPLDAIRDVLMGNPALGLPGGAYRLATAMAEAEAAGFNRSLRVLNGPERIIVQLEMKPNATHLSQARQYMARMLGTLQAKAYLALASASGTAAKRKALRDAFETWGYVDPAFTGSGLVHSATSKAWALANAAEVIIGFAWGGGWFTGLNSPDGREKLTGLRYSATLDNRTTSICRAYDGVKLPVDHPWWQTHWPMCHFRCRSVVVPMAREFVATPDSEIPWTPWPAIGFGHAPAIAVGLRYTRDVRAA